MQLTTVKIEKPDDINFVLGQSHFVKTVEDIHESIVQTVPGIKFGLAFCESSGEMLVRWTGTDDSLGGLLIVWPGAVQTIFMDVPFVGNESALFRVLGMTVAVIGWLYLFGGRSGARQFGPASVLDRVVLFLWCSCPL